MRLIKKCLHDKYMQMIRKVRGGLKGMSGFGESIAINERNKGIAKGIAEGKRKAYFKYIGIKMENKFSFDDIVKYLMKDFEISEDEAKYYVTQYNKQQSQK